VAAFALVVVLWALRRRWRGPLAGLLFFVGTLFPVLGFLNVYTFILSFVADHYQYLASLGIITLAAAGIAILLKRLQLWRRPAGYGICILLLLTLATLTWRQSRMYTDTLTLYQTTIDLNPTCWMAYNNRGIVYKSLGNYRQAIEDYNEAIRLKADLHQAYYDRGIIYGQHGQYQLAIKDYNKAIGLNPDYLEAYNNRGTVYMKMGIYQKALEDFNEAIRLKPDYAGAYNNRAFVYLNQGDKISGCRDARKACELRNCKLLEAANSRGFCR
jgi:tetratricopeptide (TPR) repeat protein